MKFSAFLVIQLAAATALAALVIFWKGPWNAERYAGAVIAFTGLFLLFTARFQLGRSFSVTPQARQLVTHGLYSRIRNPIYVFSGMMVLGVLLVIQVPKLFALLALLLILQITRAHQEAKVLEAKFGDEYREYRRKTWF